MTKEETAFFTEMKRERDPKENINTRNKHQRDESIRFIPISHRYYFTQSDGSKKSLKSVTSIISDGFGHVFDTELVIFKMMKSEKWKTNPLYGKSPKEIAEIWKQKATTTQVAGTRLHAMIEDFLLEMDCFSETSRQEPEFLQFLEFHNNQLQKGASPHRVEWCVYDEDLGVAGTIDMLYKNADGSYTICDWKRTLPQEKESFYEKTKNQALDGIHDSKQNRYALQVSAYREILERKYGLQVSHCAVVHFHPELTHPLVEQIGRQYEQHVRQLLS